MTPSISMKSWRFVLTFDHQIMKLWKISDEFCVYFSDVTTQTRQLSTDPKQSLVKGDFHCSTQFSVLDSVHKTVQLANLRQFSHKSMYKSSDNIPGFSLQKCRIFCELLPEKLWKRSKRIEKHRFDPPYGDPQKPSEHAIWLRRCVLPILNNF